MTTTGKNCGDTDFLRERLAGVIKGNHIVFLAVFGSFAKGHAREHSDLDLLVRFSERKSLPDIVRIEREMSELVGRKVDLVTEGAVSEYMKEEVYLGVRVVYEG